MISAVCAFTGSLLYASVSGQESNVPEHSGDILEGSCDAEPLEGRVRLRLSSLAFLCVCVCMDVTDEAERGWDQRLSVDRMTTLSI